MTSASDPPCEPEHLKQFLQLQRQILDAGCVFVQPNGRLAAGSPQAGLLLSLPNRVTGPKVETPIVGSFPAVVLSAPLLTAVVRLGWILRDVFGLQRELLREYNAVRTLVGRGTEASVELGQFREQSDSATTPRWMRVDIVIERSTLRPYVVDVHVLPGGIYFAAVIAQQYMTMFTHTGLSSYSVASWLPAVIAEQRELLPANRRSVAFVPPDDHPFLTMEYGHLAALDSIRAPCKRLSDSHDDLGLMLRAFRLGRLGGDELAHLQRLVKRGCVLLPAFNLWSEDHHWPYFYRAFQPDLRRRLGDDDAEFLLEHLPRTYRVSRRDGRILADTGPLTREEFEVTDSSLSGLVVKRGDSSGGRGVTICAPGGGRGVRATAMRSVSLSLDGPSPYLLQRFVRPARVRAFGVAANGRLGWTTSPVRFSAFFVDGRWVGGIVTQAPTYRVQGGWNAVNLPVLWRMDGSHSSIGEETRFV